MKKSSIYYGSNISFIDMLFNIIIVFVLLFFASLMLINEPAKKKDIEARADIIITMTWPDLSPHDIDLWLKVPEGQAIGYNHKENTYVFLERDDLGISNNFVIKDEKKVALSPRREVISFRGKIPGRYVTNINFFLPKTEDGKGVATYTGEPIPVIVELIQINPSYKILARKEIILTKSKEERTAFSFLVQNEIVSGIELDIEEPFILEQNPASGYHYSPQER
jgi:hypothetical protein